MKKYIYILFGILIGGMVACEDPDKNNTLRPYDEVPIGLYLSSRADEFSEWLTILDYADLYNATNQATELYTVFVPTNEAVRAFYADKRVERIEDLGLDYAQSLVKYHILNDTIALNDFLEGGVLVEKTMTDDYLEVTFGESAGSGEGSAYDNIYLNNDAHVREFAIEASNGLIYVLNDVMRPLVESLYETMYETELYEIMLEAMNLTGWRDTLNIISERIEQENGSMQEVRRYYTVLAVTDEVYHAEGIHSVDDLITRVGAKNDYTSLSNELNRYIAYHVLSGNVRLASLQKFDMENSSKLWQTTAENTLIKISQEADGKIYLNFDGGQIKASLLEDSSDFAVKNGYVHQLDGYLPVCTSLKPVTVYFDATDYPELGAFIASDEGNSIFQTPGSGGDTQTNIPTTLPCYDMVFGPMGSVSSWGTLVYYTVQDADWYTLSPALNYDFLLFSPGYLGTLTLYTPPMIPGKYKVSMRYAYVNSMVDFCNGLSGSNGGATMFEFPEIENLKSSMVNIYSSIPTDKRAMNLFDIDLFDEIEITELKKQPVKITIMDPAGSFHAAYRILLDYLLFEPIN